MISESNFITFGQEPKFLRLFVVFKGDVQVVYYLPKKMERGPEVGSEPVAGVVRKLELKTILYPEMEHELLKVRLIDPRGDWKI